MKTFLFVPDLLLLTLIVVVGAVVGGHVVIVRDTLLAVSCHLTEHGLRRRIPRGTGLLMVVKIGGSLVFILKAKRNL